MNIFKENFNYAFIALSIVYIPFFQKKNKVIFSRRLSFEFRQKKVLSAKYFFCIPTLLFSLYSDTMLCVSMLYEFGTPFQAYHIEQDVQRGQKKGKVKKIS